MSDRNLEILRQLTKENNIYEEDILNALSITSRQLNYSIEQINQELISRGIPVIRKEGKKFIFSEGILDLMIERQGIEDIVFSPEDRVQIIILYILMMEVALSLDHFAVDLNVSKNTVLNDMKIVRKKLAEYHLTLDYSRKNGYTINGDEWDKRILLQNAIQTIHHIYGSNLLDDLLRINNVKVNKMKDYILQIEKYLNIHYTDDDFYTLVYLLSANMQRIEKGYFIESLDFIDSREIITTAEYQALQFLTFELPHMPNQELIFIALQLLGSKKRNIIPLKKEDLPLLSNSLWEFLNEFEAKTLLVLQNKKDLLKKLMVHFKPAYYRIKYNIVTNNILHEEIVAKYEVLHNFVKKSIGPIETFFQEPLPNEEVSYITLFIGGHLLADEQIDMEENITKAVIICPNGITMSRLLEKTLRQVFPEFMFYPPLSIREYEGFILPHDIVFSTVPVVTTDKHIFIVRELPDASDKLSLRQSVIKKIYHLDFTSIDAKSLMNVIKKHADIKNETKLVHELEQLLLKESTDQSELSEEQVLLEDIITEHSIRIINHGLTWNQMLEEGSKPLIEDKKITQEYVEQLKQEFENQPEYINLRQNIIIPHLNPKKIDQKLGISIVINKAGFTYSRKRMNIMVIITTPDKTSHLDILYGINKIAGNGELLEVIKEASSSKDIKEKIIRFLEEARSES